MAGCDKKTGGSGGTVNPNNPFAGTWVQDGSGGSVTVVLTENTWTAKYENAIYNSGTYTYTGNTARWKITNEGIGSANVGDTGIATVLNNKMTVSNFSDDDMNGTYTKQASSTPSPSLALVGVWQSVGYYHNYYPETTEKLTPMDVSEKITFNSNGNGVYTANGTEKAFTWTAGEVGIEISIAPSIHNDNNWNYPKREYYVTSTQLIIFWASSLQVVYKKEK